MQLDVRKVGDVGVVTVRGRALGASNTEEFKQDMAPILGKHKNLVLNVENLEFVDSSGLGAFLSCLKQLNSAGGDMKISGMTRSVRTLFELVRMHRICDIFDTVEDAVRAFREQLSADEDAKT